MKKPMMTNKCKENWESMPYTSEHVWQGDIHGIPYGNCQKCGEPIENWNKKLEDKVKNLYPAFQKPMMTEGKCSKCKKGVNSELDGGNENCFHCSDCGYIECGEEVSITPKTEKIGVINTEDTKSGAISPETGKEWERIKRYPGSFTKKTSQWERDLDDLIGNYDMFAEKWDVDERYDWFDVIYNFVYSLLLSEHHRWKDEMKKQVEGMKVFTIHRGTLNGRVDEQWIKKSDVLALLEGGV